jgi:hypothetical protein
LESRASFTQAILTAANSAFKQSARKGRSSWFAALDGRHIQPNAQSALPFAVKRIVGGAGL